jgi:hypothetical protein
MEPFGRPGFEDRATYKYTKMVQAYTRPWKAYGLSEVHVNL